MTEPGQSNSCEDSIGRFLTSASARGYAKYYVSVYELQNGRDVWLDHNIEARWGIDRQAGS